MKYYVVSDLHSFYTPFMKALEESGFFTDSEPHKLIICGDLFDRGNEPLETEKAVSEFLDGGDAILIRGNHEDLMVEMLDFLEKTDDPFSILGTHFERNGTLKTLCDITGRPLEDVLTKPMEVVSEMRGTVAYTKLFPAARDFFETSHYVFVHGFIPCREINEGFGAPLPTFNDWRNGNTVDWNCARWMDYLKAITYGIRVPGKTVVCGHRSVRYGNADYLGITDPEHVYDPFYYDGIIAIDATTVLSGKVNCLVIEDD